jgi:SAM-dependent methyltransferase
MSTTTGGSVATDDALDEAFRTRPGTPMIGPYSVAQMDDFYAALGRGEVKPTGAMNLLQRLLITQRCRAGDRVVDVCCGRGLQLPVLGRYRPDLAGYTGLDISADNLAQGRARAEREPAPFPVAFVHADVSQPWPVPAGFDIAVYTSALEHLPREAGLASLQRVAAALTDGGRLFLSTPNTPGPPPRRLQHRVHVYARALHLPERAAPRPAPAAGLRARGADRDGVRAGRGRGPGRDGAGRDHRDQHRAAGPAGPGLTGGHAQRGVASAGGRGGRGAGEHGRIGADRPAVGGRR